METTGVVTMKIRISGDFIEDTTLDLPPPPPPPPSMQQLLKACKKAVREVMGGLTAREAKVLRCVLVSHMNMTIPWKK